MAILTFSAKPIGYTAGMAYGRQRGGGKRPQPATVDQAVELLRAEAVRMFDRGDGRELDWPVVAQALFKTAFEVADAEPVRSERMLSVLRRAEAGFYNRLAGNGDDGLPSPVQVAEPGEGRRIDNSAMRPSRAPSPKLKQ